MSNQMPNLVRKAEYAKRKGVTATYISKLTSEKSKSKKKLIVQKILDMVYIVDCPENDLLFSEKK